jgi:DeoR/GlpR family transcriptional regulator of sugar metabolism
VDLKKLVASSCRQKILKELSTQREMRVMKLVSKVNGTYNEVNRNLEILEKEGIIINEYRKMVRHNIVRVIILQKENERTKILLQALRMLEKEND